MTEPDQIDTSYGKVAVTTESGTRYMFDIDVHAVTRIPEAVRVDEWLEAGNIKPETELLPPGELQRTPALRRDGETIRLVGLGPIVIGERCVMLLDLLEAEPAVITTRETSPVVSIERVPGRDCDL